jgi:hypothetical protein
LWTPEVGLGISDAHAMPLVRLLAAAGALLAMVLAGAAPAIADLSAGQIIPALTAQRRANGIPPVRRDARMSGGCAAHDRYLLRNDLSVMAEHYQTPGRPGYNPAGDHATRTSVLREDVGQTVGRSWVSVGRSRPVGFRHLPGMVVPGPG